MVAGIRIEPYGSVDGPAVVELWNAAVGPAYPLREVVLHQVLEANPSYRPGDAVVARADDAIVGFGFAGLHRLPDPETAGFRARGHVQAIVVAEGLRRRGIGRAIAATLAGVLAAGAIQRVEAGAGMFYLWPGIPLDVPGATDFATALGFEPGGETYDLRGDVTDLAIGRADRGRLAAVGRLGPASATDRAAVLTFLDREFGGEWWHETGWFLDRGGDPSDLLLLRTPDDAIVGLVRLHRPGGSPVGAPRFWVAEDATGTGGLGPIGVAAKLRGRGVGRALLVAALDVLRAEGLTDVVIDYTSLLGYYGPHGFRPWRTYRHATIPIARLAAAADATAIGR